MRILVSATGSRGDVHPLLGFACSLRKLGHDVLFTAPADFEEDATALGFAFRAHSPAARELIVQNSADAGANPFRLMRAIRRVADEHLDLQFSTFRSLPGSFDCVFATGLTWSASSYAEAIGAHYRFITYAPDVIASGEIPPALFPSWGLPRFANRLAWGVFSAIVDWTVLGGVNRHRAELGLRPLDRVLPHAWPPQKVWLLAEPELARWPSDVHGAEPHIGSFRYPDTRPLDPIVEDFLERGSRPVYIGFGSMVDPNPLRSTRTIVEAVEAAGVRAILSSGWASLGGGDVGPNVLVVDSTPHEKLFPRVAAVIHHGGAGTTHAAARAGVPQILVPHLLDQFGWGERVYELGLGPRPIPRGKLSAPRLSEAIVDCLKIGGYSSRAREIGNALRGRDPLSNMRAALSGMKPRVPSQEGLVAQSG